MKLSIREAFDLTPTKVVKVGPREYAVPPLTFGRLDELVRSSSGMNPTLLASFRPGEVKDAEQLGRALVDFPVGEFADAAAAVMPEMTAEAWREHGDPFVLLKVAGFLARTHDWRFISEHLYGRDRAKDAAPDVTLQTALVLLAKSLGCKVTDLIEFRAEGFFACVDAIHEKADLEEKAREKAEREAEGWTGPQPLEDVVPVVKDPTKSAALDALIANAEKRAQEGAANG